MTDNVLQKYLSPSAGYDDESYDINIPKTPKGIPPKDELDLLYNSKYEMEDSEDEKSPPASQMEPRHKTYHQNNEENSLSLLLQYVCVQACDIHRYQNNYIDEMTKKWFSQTSNPPRIPIFYTPTKIHKPNPVGRLIILGCEGPTERLSSFVDKLLQPIAQTQKSYLKDTTHFINFIEKTKVSQNTILVSMDVTSLYTNIPQEEGITTLCTAYEKFHNYNPPIPSHYLKEMLCLILKENLFQFIGKNYLQTHGTAMGTKMAVAFANIFMAEIETKLINQSNTKPLKWKRYIDDIFSLWDSNIQEIELFMKQANNFHPTTKFTAEISETEITFLDTIISKGERFRNESILDI